MAGILSQLTASPLLRNYAAGLAPGLSNPVAEFLAPSVEVPTTTGRFKKYLGGEALLIPETRRAIGGTAAMITFGATDGNYNVEPHALDFPADQLTQLESAETGMNILMQGASVASQIAALSHEKRVLDKVIEATSSTVPLDLTGDPIDVIDQAVLDVNKAAGGWSGIMQTRVVIGLTMMKRLKNHPKILNRCISAGGIASTATPNITEQQLSSMILKTPPVMVSSSVYNAAAQNAALDLQWLLEDSIIVFIASPNPTIFDPSAFKTFRLMGQWMTPRAYSSQDGRVDYQGWDWTADVQNVSTAVKRLVISSTPLPP